MKKRIVALMLALLMAFVLVGCDSKDYEEAMGLFEAGQYAAAEAMFLELGDYENSAEMVNRCRYEKAQQQYREGDYQGAAAAFTALGNFQDSKEMVKKANFQILREYVLENGEADDGTVMLSTIYDGAVVAVFAAEDDKDHLELAYYSESNILAKFTYTTVVEITCGEDEGSMVSEHDMDMYYSGRYAYSEADYEGVFAISKFTRTSRVTLTSYNEKAMNIYGRVTTDTDVENAPADDLHTHLYTMIDGIAAYLEDNNVGVTIQDIGFASWE